MPAGNDNRDLIRAMKDLTSSQTRLAKICEALNNNLVALANPPKALTCNDAACEYEEVHKHGFACGETCTTCKGRNI